MLGSAVLHPRDLGTRTRANGLAHTVKELISKEEARKEVRENYGVFAESLLADLLKKHSGQWVLLHDREVVDVFPGAGHAYREGMRQFPDHRFSIQEVREQTPVRVCPHIHIRDD